MQTKSSMWEWPNDKCRAITSQLYSIQLSRNRGFQVLFKAKRYNLGTSESLKLHYSSGRVIQKLYLRNLEPNFDKSSPVA